MQEQPNKVEREDDRRIQRTVVLHLLCSEHEESWSKRELESELVAIDPPLVEAALESLKQVGLVRVEDDKVLATEAAKRLETLDLIAL
jgi:Mn-dependent DtxR family transcriptional regulator